MFDPALPAQGSPLASVVMRSQLTSLKELIGAILIVMPDTEPGPKHKRLHHAWSEAPHPSDVTLRRVALIATLLAAAMLILVLLRTF